MAKRNKPFFTYQADAPDENPPSQCKMTKEEWESLSPGFRREISRYFGKIR